MNIIGFRVKWQVPGVFIFEGSNKALPFVPSALFYFKTYFMEAVMQGGAGSSRRSFVMCCACVGCAKMLGAAELSSRNTKSLKEMSPASGGATGVQTAAKKSYDFAFCGIYCTACALHLTGGKDGKKCKGCTHPSMQSKCVIFACAKEKKVANCGLCESFETCEKLKKHHEKPLYRQVARRTCTKIKQDGFEVVAAEQKKRWTCKSCGKLFPWNTTGTCSHCGKAVDALSDKEA